MGGVHGQQNRNARVEQNFLLQARQAKLPIVGEHGVPAVAENTLKKFRCVGKAASAENHERTRQNAECARHAQRMAELTRAAGRQVVFRRLAQAVQTAPDEVGQPRAVPQAADEEGYNQVSVLARLAAPAAAQRNIDVIPQPLRQADVPPRPDVLDRVGKERLAEVFRQVQAQHLADAQHNVGVAGEIGVELHGEQHAAQQQLGAVKGGGVGKDCIHNNGGAVRHGQLFKVAPRAALYAAPDPVRIPDSGPVQLRHQGAIAVEGALRDREKERRIAQKAGVFFLRQNPAPAHVTQIADELQRKIADAQSVRQRALPAQRSGQILEQGQRQQCRRKPRKEHGPFRGAPPAPPDQKAAARQHRQCCRAEHRVK